MTSLENRNSSALFKRAEQLKRWSESDTNSQDSEPKRKSQRIQFTDGCVFLAACAASDKDEVERLQKRGADIDTANIDGLTALHQACIDDNLDMVEFLVERGADVNRGDNEGWTPLHATASCGFLSIAGYLLEYQANVSAVNNDGELAIDISESDEMEELLQKEIDKQGINCDLSRNTEERLMLEDARSWLNSKVFGDVPHVKTGATALHVSAAKGYIKVMGILLQAGAAVNAQDFDGWTPLHAAAHWAQREACEILCENYANMDIKNYVGQSAFDVADPDVLRLLEELKKKQLSLQKDRPEIRVLFNRPPVPPGQGQQTGKRSTTYGTILSATTTTGATTPSSPAAILTLAPSATSAPVAPFTTSSSTTTQPSNSQNSNSTSSPIIYSSISNGNESSITRLSVDDKAERSKAVSSQERDLLLHKTIEERKGELDSPDVEAKSFANHSILHKADTSDQNNPTSRAPGYSPPHLEERTPRKTLTVVNADGELEEIHPWRRPASLRVRPTFNSENATGANSGTSNKLSPAGIKEEDDVQLRRVHSFESDEKFYAKLTELRARIRNNSSSTAPNTDKLAGTGSGPATLGPPGSTPGSNPAPAGSRGSTSKHLANSLTPSNNNNNNESHLSSGGVPHGVHGVHHAHRGDPVGGHGGLSVVAEHDPPSLSSNEDSSLSSSSSMSTNPSSLSSDASSWSASRKKRGDHGTQPKSDPPKQQPSQVRRSFVPPVRDEESETQRKAHAKRVRETRRSTQGVTLEDLKSAEQLVKKKQQQENQQRTSELQQLVASQQQEQLKKYSPTTVPSVSVQQPSSGSSSAASSITALPTSTSIAAAAAAVTSGSTSSIASNASLTGDSTERHERRPSWRLRLDTSDKNKFRLEEDLVSSLSKGPPFDSRGNKNQNNALTALARKGSKYESARSPDLSSPSIPEHTEVPSVTITSSTGITGVSTTSSTPSSPSMTGLQPSNHRRKKPKRRSTGVVNLDMDDLDGVESDESSISSSADNANAAAQAGSATDNAPHHTASSGTGQAGQNKNNNASSSISVSAENNSKINPSNHVGGGTDRPSSGTADRSQNGEIDYRKLWEQAQLDNSRLRDDLARTRDELSAAKKKLDTMVQTPSTTSGLTDTEKKEKIALEKKLSEMEEELKQLEHLKNDNQRLRDENGALIRVISKLSK